jgi:hypothetical protein
MLSNGDLRQYHATTHRKPLGYIKAIDYNTARCGPPGLARNSFVGKNMRAHNLGKPLDAKKKLRLRFGAGNVCLIRHTPGLARNERDQAQA